MSDQIHNMTTDEQSDYARRDYLKYNAAEALVS